MSRLWLFVEKHGFDLLIVIAALASALGTAVRNDAERPTGAMSWLEVPVIALVVLILLARHRYPFAAPASFWLVSAALSFIDGNLIANQTGVFLAGLGAALLLGNLRNDLEARIGLAIVVSGAAIVVYNQPGHDVGEYLFIPALFTIGGWSASPCASATSRPRRPRNGPHAPSASARWRPGWRWPRNADGSPASCTTSSRTRSA